MNFAAFNVLFPEQSGLPQGKGNKKSEHFSKIFFPNNKNYQDFFSATSPSQMAQYYCGVSIANKWIWIPFHLKRRKGRERTQGGVSPRHLVMRSPSFISTIPLLS